VQLLDKDQQAVASLYSWPLHGAYRVRAWQPGETMPLSLILPVPDDLRPGAYRLIVGAFDLLQHQRIPLRTGEDTAALETLRIVLPLDSRAPQTPAAATFGDAIELTGYTLTPTADGLALALFWKALAEPPTDFTSFVHIVDAAGEIVAQSDAQPRQGQYPTSIWQPGEVVVDDRSITVPPGEYRIYLGWYRTDTLERLPLTSETGSATDDRTLLGVVTLP
jgi:hypothetical protein